VVKGVRHPEEGEVVEDHMCGVGNEVEDGSEDGAGTEHAQDDQILVDQT